MTHALKGYTKELSILCIDNDLEQLKDLNKFLKKIFLKIDLASDAIEGLENYKTKRADIVILDLHTSGLNGFELTKTLKKINSKLKVIITSSDTTSENLLEAFHIGINDFIPKPIDNKLLTNTLLRIIKEIHDTNTILDESQIKVEKDIFKQFDLLFENNTTLNFSNEYEGVPIVHKGTIVDVDEHTISIQVPSIQALAMKVEGSTNIVSNFLDTVIKARFLRINYKTKEVILKNFSKLDYSLMPREHIRMTAGNDLIIVLHKGHHKINTTIQNISINSVLVTIDKDYILDEQDELKLTFGINIQRKSKQSDEIFYANGRVFKVTEQTKKVELIVLFELPKAKKNILEKHLQNRQIEIIKEFKKIRNKNKL